MTDRVDEIIQRVFAPGVESSEVRQLLRHHGLVIIETKEFDRPPLKEALRQLAVLAPGMTATAVPMWMRDNNWGAIINSLCAEALARIEELEAALKVASQPRPVL